jgi:hypothetical protein
MKRLAAILITIGASSAAHALPSLIDFTDNSQWTSSTSSRSYNGVTVTLNAYSDSNTYAAGSPQNLNYTPYDGGTNSGSCTAAVVLKCNWDGLGVRRVGGPGDDEYRGSQFITATFSTPVSVSRLFFLDMFPGIPGTLNENGKYAVKFGSDASFTENNAYAYTAVGAYSTGPASPAYTGGYLSQQVDLSNVTSLKFYIPSNNNSSVALAGIEIGTVPTPSAISLLLIGLAASGATLRKRRATQLG